jgi:hypothetical protein
VAVASRERTPGGGGEYVAWDFQRAARQGGEQRFSFVSFPVRPYAVDEDPGWTFWANFGIPRDPIQMEVTISLLSTSISS